MRAYKYLQLLTLLINYLLTYNASFFFLGRTKIIKHTVLFIKSNGLFIINAARRGKSAYKNTWKKFIKQVNQGQWNTEHLSLLFINRNTGLQVLTFNLFVRKSTTGCYGILAGRALQLSSLKLHWPAR